MSNLKTILLKTNKENKYIEISLYYSLGGINYFTYKSEPRGYYISVTPIEKGNGFVSFTIFSGVKDCILTVERKSKKAEAKALELFQIYPILQDIVDYVCNKAGLELIEKEVTI